jgi:hypothetical protein
MESKRYNEELESRENHDHMCMGDLKDTIIISHKLLLHSLKNVLSRIRFTLHKVSFIPRVNWPCPFTTRVPNALKYTPRHRIEPLLPLWQGNLQIGTHTETVYQLQYHGITCRE